MPLRVPPGTPVSAPARQPLASPDGSVVPRPAAARPTLMGGLPSTNMNMMSGSPFQAPAHPAHELSPPAAIDHRRVRLAADGSWHVAGSRCTQCDRLYHPVRTACSHCGGLCKVEDLPIEGRSCVATQVRSTRPGVVIPPPYQIVLVRVAENVVVRAPSLEAQRWVPGEIAYLRPLSLRGDSDSTAIMSIQVSRKP